MPRRLAALLLAAAASPVFAQPVPLAEPVVPGECAKYSIELAVSGNLFVTQEKGREAVKLEARARHVFVERTLAADAGLPLKTARHYETATATAVVGGERVERTLSPDRALIVARRDPSGPFCFAPAGPLTRDELDLVTEHFNPHCLPGLLPGKDVGVNDTWPVNDAAAQAACQFHRLARNGLTGKLTAVAGGLATFTVEGTAEGFENGGKVTLTVAATGTFDAARRRVVGLTWKQSDDRGASPVGPASKVEATVVLRREAPAAEPPALADAALGGVPKGDVPAALAALRHADPKGRYTLRYARDWHVTGETDSHLVLRLLDGGTFAAQATVSVWPPLPAGRRPAPDEFKKAVSGAKGWTATKVLDDREVPAGDGRWLYRFVAEGTLDGERVVQGFHLLAGPKGEQVVVVFTTHPGRAAAPADRDLALVRAVEFPAK